MTRVLRIVVLGQPMRLLGVSRSGSEYACAEGYLGWAWDTKGGWTCHAGVLALRRHARG